MKKKVKDFGLIFWAHVIVIFIMYASPFLFDWKIVLFIFILYTLQNFIIGGCVISMAQFHDKEERFFQYYFKKLGLNIDRRKIDITIDYIIVPLLFLFALFWQLVLHKTPLIY